MQHIYSFGAISRAMRDKIAKEFKAYFVRGAIKGERVKMSMEDASKLIDYAGSPGRSPGGITYNYAAGLTRGGGTRKPSYGEIVEICRKYYEDEVNPWDIVFDKIMERYTWNTSAGQLILMSFCDCLSVETISAAIGVSEYTYYRNRRGLLDQAAFIAVSEGIIEEKDLQCTAIEE